MKKLISFLILTQILFFFCSVSPVRALFGDDDYDYQDNCTKEIGVGGCVNNRKCIISGTKIVDGKTISIVTESNTTNCNSSDIGAVTPPAGIAAFDQKAVGSSPGKQNIGIIVFASNLLQLFAIIAGLWAMFNFFMAGYMYITAMSDAGVTEKVKDKVTMTVIGLAIIAGSYIIAGLIGLVMFGDATFIINPKLYGVSTAAPTP